MNGRLLVPTIVLAEAPYMAERKRLLDFEELDRRLRGDATFEIVGFGEDILQEVMRIREVPELHDRIIAATARFYGAGILTKDRVLPASGAEHA